MMMNRGKFEWTWKDQLKHLIMPDYIMRYLKSMRYLQYLSDGQHLTPPDLVRYIFHRLRYTKLGYKLGFSIGWDTLGYGVVIPHYGTIVIGESNRIGNYAVLHTSTCISDNSKEIGDAFYMATGVKITSKVRIGNNVSIGANSLVNKNLPDNCMAGGIPAQVIKTCDAWFIRDGKAFTDKVNAIETLKHTIQ